MTTPTPFPLKFIRQQAEPIDVDQEFETTADRTAYLTNPRRYRGMIVFDVQQDKIYRLNAARTAWISMNEKDPYPTFTVDTDQTIDIPAASLLKGFLVTSNENLSGFTIGSTSTETDLVPGMEALVANTPIFFTATKFFPSLTSLYVKGLNTNTAIVDIIAITEKF